MAPSGVTSCTLSVARAYSAVMKAFNRAKLLCVRTNVHSNSDADLNDGVDENDDDDDDDEYCDDDRTDSTICMSKLFLSS